MSGSRVARAAALLTAGVAATSAAVPGQAAEQALDRAATVYAAMRTARVTFTQTVSNPLTRHDVTSKGEMLQRLPGSYAVTFSDPVGDRIISDGKVVWIYLPSTNPGQVIKAPVHEGGSGIPDFTSWLLDAPKDRFALADGGAATIAGRATHVVVLTPKRATAPFTRATLWIEEATGIVRQFETMDGNGSVRRVRVDAIEMNVPVSARTFLFTPPPGVKVFETGAAT